MAFGSVPGPDEGVGVPTNLPDPNDDIHAIRERYVIPVVNTPIPFSLGPLLAGRIDLRNQMINALLVTIQSGTVFGYFGDFTANNGKAPTTPHFIVSAAIARVSQTIPIAPSNQYIITLQEPDGGTVVGSFTGQAL